MVLANPGNTQVARVAAGLQVKNSLTSKDPDVKTRYQQRWLAIDANARCEIKNYVRPRPQSNLQRRLQNVLACPRGLNAPVCVTGFTDPGHRDVQAQLGLSVCRRDCLCGDSC